LTRLSQVRSGRRRCLAALGALLLLSGGFRASASAQTPATASDTGRRVRRQPVTPELERTAFTDARARTLLERARAARIAQDSALLGYDAKTYQRLSVGMGFRRIGRNRLLFRTEQTARVRWARGGSVLVEPTGRRTAFPMGDADLDLTRATPIPYFPGRESLWLPSSYVESAKAEVDENDFLHPLATGAEAYYRYATGDSVSIKLPDGRGISLRELRITARRPEWRAFVGSFWFDVERGNLVRAAYRMSTDLDIWAAASEEQRRKVEEWEERARTDTGAAARRARSEAERERRDEPSLIAKTMFSPMRANISSITVEYGLYEGRFWLPKRNVAEGQVQAAFMRMPVKVEESFTYNRVNGAESMPELTVATQTPLTASDTTWPGGGHISLNVGRTRGDTSIAARTAREDSLISRYERTADGLRKDADELRAKGDSVGARDLLRAAEWHTARARQILRRRAGCANDTTYLSNIGSRYNGAVRMSIRMPCDESRLANSPDLPGSVYDPGEELFGTGERDELLKSLDFALQPGWAPQRPVLHTGLDLMRYNRIEGLSVGGTATSVLGRGYTVEAIARLGTADLVPNGELTLSRSNGRSTLRTTLFHRLGVANDDWGSPLSLGASIATLLNGRDEGFYYRTYGAEVAGSRDAPGPLGGATILWRLFAERQRSAGHEPNTQVSLARALGGRDFALNIDATQLTALGAGGDIVRSFGADPARLRLDTRLRTEAAFTDRSDSIGTSGYGRVVLEGTLARPLGRLAGALTGAAGVAAGDLPVQRAFFLGGVQTVRGQFAHPQGAGYVGDAFWLGRAELGLVGGLAVRPTLFYDIGWAGPREDFGRPARSSRPLSGAGVGLSMLDGLVRLDVSRGIYPEKRWRFDLYLEARF
jgi:hypothetical protein